MDLSKVPFPQAPVQSASHGHIGTSHLSRTTSASSATLELSCLLSKAIGERLAGKAFELLNVSECGISTEQLSDLMDGIIKSGLRRLGLAGNAITSEGMKHVARFINCGHCEGLDLGGNDLRDQMGVVVDALDDSSNLFALSLADCHLTPDSLWTLFPALTKLKNFRFIDLSQNHDLFETSPSALSLLRRYVYFGGTARLISNLHIHSLLHCGYFLMPSANLLCRYRRFGSACSWHFPAAWLSNSKRNSSRAESLLLSLYWLLPITASGLLNWALFEW